MKSAFDGKEEGPLPVLPCRCGRRPIKRSRHGLAATLQFRTHSTNHSSPNKSLLSLEMPPVAGPAEDQKAKLLLALRSRYENRAALNDWKNANELDKAIHALEYLPRDVRSLRDLEGVKGFPEKMRKIVQKVLDKWVEDRRFVFLFMSKWPHSSRNTVQTLLMSLRRRQMPWLLPLKSPGHLSCRYLSLFAMPPFLRNRDSKQSASPFRPAPNSGGRAMLIALYKETLKEGHPGFLHKDWLVQRAKVRHHRPPSLLSILVSHGRFISTSWCLL